MTPREAAIDLIKHYVLRGDDAIGLKKSHLGSFGSDYGAMIGGYANGKFHSDKIIVSKIDGQECCFMFDFYEIFNEIKGGQQSLL